MPFFPPMLFYAVSTSDLFLIPILYLYHISYIIPIQPKALGSDGKPISSEPKSSAVPSDDMVDGEEEFGEFDNNEEEVSYSFDFYFFKALQQMLRYS